MCAKTIKKNVNGYGFGLRKVVGDYAPGAVCSAQLPVSLDQIEFSYGWKYGYEPVEQAHKQHGSLILALKHFLADGAKVYVYLASIDDRLAITVNDLVDSLSVDSISH